MATVVSNQSKYNNLLASRDRKAIINIQEHQAGRVGMDLRPKTPAKTFETLTTAAAKINGKQGDFIYEPTILAKSRPYYGYDARYDPTLLNSIRDKYVDVSGTLIPNSELKSAGYIQQSVNPLIAYDIIL